MPTEKALTAVINTGLKDPQGAILAIPVRDSLKRAVISVNDETGVTHIESSVDREALWQAQTPQVLMQSVCNRPLSTWGH